MGRYTYGDIEHKFWFGVQPSNDADFFGVEGYQPEQLEYYYEQEHLPSVKEGIQTCIKELGEYKIKMDTFFKENEAYNEKMLSDYLEMPIEKVSNLLIWYARLDLGNKIKECIEEQGDCNFTAEC